MAKNKTPVQTNVRLSPTARRLLQHLAQMFGITQRDVIEVALRQYAQSVGVWRPRKFRGSEEGGEARD